MSGKKFNCFYYEPLLWCAIVYADVTMKELTDDQIKMAYILYFAQTMIKYLTFMYSTITQLLDFLQLPFITVVKKTKAD